MNSKSKDKKTLPEEESAFMLPFNPAIVIRTIWRRKYIVILLTLIAIICGYLLASRLMKTTFSTEAVLLRSEDITDPVALGAFEDMAHLPSTYKLYRKNLGSELSIRQLAKLVFVTFEKKSGLVRMYSEHTDPVTASHQVNAFVETFSEVTRQFRRSSAIEKFNYFSARLKQTREKLREVENLIRLFKKKHAVVDMSKQVKSLVIHYNHFDQIYEESRARAKELKMKLKRMKSIIAELGEKAKKDEKESAATLRSRTTMRKQSGRLKEKILEDKREKELKIMLSTAIDDLAKYEDLLRQGVVSGSQVEAKREALLSVENQLNQSPEIKKMEDEIEKIDAGIIPKSDGEGASALILKEMVIQQIDLRLEEITADELVSFYKKTRDDIKVELQRLPALEAEFNSLDRRLSKLSLYEVDLKKSLDEARLKIDSEITAFHVIQKASVPVYPNTTKRILVILAMTILGFTSGLFLTFMISIFESKLRRGGEVKSQLGFNLLQGPSINIDNAESGAFTDDNSQWLVANLINELGGISSLYDECKVVMVTSLELGEGRTRAIEAIYESLTLSGIDVKTLSLDYRGESTCSWQGCSPDDVQVFSPDQLESASIGALIDRLKKDSQVILIEAPPCEPWVDAEVIASYSDACILVLEAGRHRSMSIRWSLKALESEILRRPLGVVLTDEIKVSS